VVLHPGPALRLVVSDGGLTFHLVNLHVRVVQHPAGGKQSGETHPEENEAYLRVFGGRQLGEPQRGEVLVAAAKDVALQARPAVGRHVAGELALGRRLGGLQRGLASMWRKVGVLPYSSSGQGANEEPLHVVLGKDCEDSVVCD
jgi:hypothetical protein